MILKILLVLSILFQLGASIYAVRLVRTTRYNVIWWLFIVGFFLLSGERIMQLIWLETSDFPMDLTIWVGIVVSIALSVGVMFAHRLFQYIARLDRHRQVVNRHILTAVLRAEERSSSHVAKELHDGLGPLLSSAKMSLSAISLKERDKEQQAIIENTAYVIDEAIRSVREISNNMSPHVLMNFGLVRGVRNFIDKGTAMHGLKVHFRTNLKEERYDTDVEVILYRVICELINNSLKHAACTEITLRLLGHGDLLTVEYADNGKGFDPEKMMDCGMGLSNMHSRIHSLGGILQISSREGEGMQATVHVRLQTSRPQEEGSESEN